MSTASQAREAIGQIIKAKPKGVYGVWDMSGVHFTRIYAFLAGGSLGEENAGKLRAALPEVPAELWADAFAPLPSERPEHGAAEAAP